LSYDIGPPLTLSIRQGLVIGMPCQSSAPTGTAGPDHSTMPRLGPGVWTLPKFQYDALFFGPASLQQELFSAELFLVCNINIIGNESLFVVRRKQKKANAIAHHWCAIALAYSLSGLQAFGRVTL
jgi:hypothetical protein